MTTTAPKLDPNTVLVVAAIGVGGYLLLRDDSPDIEDIPEPNQRPTLSDTTLAGIANRIHAAFWEGGDFYENEEMMCAALLQCNNDADVYRVIQYYGVRGGPYLLSNEYDLFGVFAQGLDDDESTALNQLLVQKGITYTF